MTETEWLACKEPYDMPQFLVKRGVKGFRKYRLLMAAYCRAFLPLMLEDERLRRVVELAEAYADGTTTVNDLAKAKREALKAVEHLPRRLDRLRLDHAVRCVTHGLPARSAAEFPYWCLHNHQRSNYWRPTPKKIRQIVRLIHDIFGNPFRPAAALDAIRGTANGKTVRKLAAVAYENLVLPKDAPDGVSLPVLADALEDAGYIDAELLGHLRRPGPHVRGCWALDLVLSRE
jgi:hypothetical protein